MLPTSQQRHNYRVQQKERAHQRMLAEIIDDLPKGARYDPLKSSIIKNDELPKDHVRAGDFIVDISEMSLEGLRRIRRFLPREAYRNIRCRKNSRLVRTKKKMALNGGTGMEEIAVPGIQTYRRDFD